MQIATQFALLIYPELWRSLVVSFALGTTRVNSSMLLLFPSLVLFQIGTCFRLEWSDSFSLYQSPVIPILHVSLYYSSCSTCHIVSISSRCVLRSQLVSFMSVFGIIETSIDAPQFVRPASSICICVSLCVLYVFQCYSSIQCSVITFTPPYQCV